MEIVFATNNQNKLLEVRALVGSEIQIKSLTEIGCEEEIPETGVTFQENASQKSHFILNHYHLPCFADDSGLLVEALGGEPGVYSARYSGSRDMNENIDFLLKKLKGVPNREAYFITLISLLIDGKELFFEGRIAGEITTERRGENGFGYDPVFVPKGYSKTFAEMSDQEKNEISHRGIAVKKLVTFLNNL